MGSEMCIRDSHSMVRSPELDRLLDAIDTEQDPNARARAAKDAQQWIANDALILPIYDQQNHFLYRSALEGFRALPTVNTPWLGNAVAH